MTIGWEVVVGGIGVIASIVAAYFTALITARNEERRIREELKLEYSAEEAITQLLDRQGWELRSFKTIKGHLKGFEDDELRKLLVRSGAIAFQQEPEDRHPDDPDRHDPEKLERWGLMERNLERLHKKS